MHDLPLITTIAAAFTAAWLLGLLTQRLGLSPIVGYLLGGVLIGPYTPGFVGDIKVANELAEVGVILLMFGVGLHFHVKDLLAVKGVAIPGAILRSLIATLVATAVFGALGVPARTGAVIGMAMAIASTVVLLRVLMDADALGSPEGHVAVGWLIVEDLVAVVLLVLIPVLAADTSIAAPGTGTGVWARLGLALLKLLALVGIVMVGGSRVIPWVLQRVARLRSRELFTLTILVLSIAVAAGSYLLFGASMALGAFLAGMVVGQSPVSHQAAADVLPLRDAFAVLFFVAVGMLFDPIFVLREPLLVLAALGVILIAKPVAALIIIALLGSSARTALTVALGSAQIGEFSFILAQLSRDHGLLDEPGHHLLVAGAILSITLNPVIFRSLPRIERALRGSPRLWRLLNARAERRAIATNLSVADRVGSEVRPSRQLAVVVGYGPAGRAVNRLLGDAGIATVVVDLNADALQELEAAGQPGLFGDATNAEILEQAGVRRASHVIVTLPRAQDRAGVIAATRYLNPDARILVRARYLRERDELAKSGVAAAVFEEAEGAVALARLVLTDTGVHRQAAEEKVRDLRLQLIRENLSSIRTQKVRSVMMPWNRVQWLPAADTKENVLRRVAQERFSRWPVVDARTGTVAGYLLAKDLVARAAVAQEWTKLVRQLGVVRADETIEDTLTRMQGEGATVYLVEGENGPLGLITLEDILEQVVGRIEDEYPHDPGLSLPDTVAKGGIVLGLAGSTPEQVIRELVAVIPARRLPPEGGVAEMAIAREAEISTDLGNGVAVPHARCAQLAAPLIAFGRSEEGVIFSSESRNPVHLVFLLLTPAERPDMQLSLLAKIAGTVGDPTARERLRQAASPAEVLDVLSKLSPRNVAGAS